MQPIFLCDKVRSRTITNDIALECQSELPVGSTSLDFDGTPPDAAALSRQWHEMLNRAQETIAALPPDQSGKCVLSSDGALFTEEGKRLVDIVDALTSSRIIFHGGSIRGSFPELVRRR